MSPKSVRASRQRAAGSLFAFGRRTARSGPRARTATGTSSGGPATRRDTPLDDDAALVAARRHEPIRQRERRGDAAPATAPAAVVEPDARPEAGAKEVLPIEAMRASTEQRERACRHGDERRELEALLLAFAVPVAIASAAAPGDVDLAGARNESQRDPLRDVGLARVLAHVVMERDPRPFVGERDGGALAVPFASKTMISSPVGNVSTTLER